jgi:hypothetical protein
MVPTGEKMKRTIIILAIWLTALPVLAQEPSAPAATATRYQTQLAMIATFQKKVADLHPALASLYPVALVENGQFYVFEPDASNKSWRLAAQGPDKYNVPVGVRAAMPLDFWGNRMACVVTPDVFDQPGGYATILHEFVHCFQWQTVEAKLKEGLAIYREAMASHDFMWELQYPFPYGNAEVRRVYGLWQAALAADTFGAADHWRSVLKKELTSRDWEYMTWQEWKEGLARYLENIVRRRLGLSSNLPAADAPFDRVAFYRGGELFIRRLQRAEPSLEKDIGMLYLRIFASGS